MKSNNKQKNILFLIFLSFAIYAAPEDDFANILEYAVNSSNSEIAENLLNNEIQNHKSKIKNSLFPWRAEVTNGYKEGFFYHAILGYVNEQNGDIPFAYQCYRNATLYIDEEKSFNYPEPTAEIYLGIGRTCLAAGRYIDAKDWLDAAYSYANNNFKLLAAIDRILIHRGNEIGDYEEIISHYEHLEQVSRPDSEEHQDEQNSPLERGARQGGVCSLTKPEIANYSQILFNTGKDRKGFMELLNGISKIGIDNNLGINDSLVNKFLNNVMRADDEEVKYFYDLLGWAILEARAKAGDEKYLAFLCNARTIFCKFYDFLAPANDLKNVKKRIDVVKKKLLDETKLSVVDYQLSNNKKIKKSQNRKIDKSGKVDELPELKLENLLMQADCQFKNKDFSNALTNYLIAAEISTGAFANLEYDGTTTKNAAIMGAIQCDLQLQSQFDFDSSFRSAELTLLLYLSATNNKQRLQYNAETAASTLPRAYPAKINYLRKEAKRLTQVQDYENAKNYYKQLEKNKGILKIEDAKEYAAILMHLGKNEKAFSVLLGSLNNNMTSFYWKEVIQKLCFQSWSYGSEEDLSDYCNSALPAKIKLMLRFTSPMTMIRDAPSIMELLTWREKIYEKEKKIRDAFRKGNYKTVITLLSEKQKYVQPGQLIKKGIAFRELEKPNEAIDCFLKAMQKNQALLKGLSSNNSFYVSSLKTIV